MFLSIILNNIKNRNAIKIYQSAMFMPYILSSSVVAYVAFAFLDVNYGFLNRLAEALGGEAVMWYSEPKYWPLILVVINLWKSVGYSVILYYASLIGIDVSYYESATIDGANKWQATWHITVPMLMPIAITLFLLNIGKIFNADFGLFYMVPKDSGMLYPTTDVIDTYVYRALKQRGDMGIASATGLYQSVVGFGLVVFSNWLVKRYDKDYGLF
jgi:putative aldouronate transport system permease protein